MVEVGVKKSECVRKISAFNLFDALLIILSLLSIVYESFTDGLLVVEYFQMGYNTWAVVSFMLVLLPSYVVQIFSFLWHISDSTYTLKHCILHALLLGVLHRFFIVLHLGLKARRASTSVDNHRVFAALSNASSLQLFDAFLKAAPQLVVQLYIISSLQHVLFVTGLSVSASVFCLAVAVLTYSHVQGRTRSDNGPNWSGFILQNLWQLGMLTARVCALVILLLAFQVWFLLFIGLHWVSMLVWITYQRTDLTDKKWRERCYDAAAAFIYCFSFFNLRSGRSRWRLLSFYTLLVLQNLTCLTMFLMFYQEKTPQLGVIAFVAILGGTFVGILSLAGYYRFFHPSRPLLVCGENKPESQSVEETTFRSLKHLSGKSLPHTGLSQRSNSGSNPEISNSKLMLSDSIVIVEESDMEEIRTLQGWIQEAAVENRARTNTSVVSSPSIELYEGASSVLSAHDYENLAAVNIARAGLLRSWRGYCDIDDATHDSSVGRDGRTLTSSTPTTSSSQDYLESIIEDYAECKAASSLHTILEEAESSCSERSRQCNAGGQCALVATIEQIRIATPMQEERGSRVRRTFSLLREKFESYREPPPPTAPWAARECSTPTRFVSVKDMRDFFLRQVLTPPKLAALRRKVVVSPI